MLYRPVILVLWLWWSGLCQDPCLGAVFGMVWLGKHKLPAGLGRRCRCVSLGSLALCLYVLLEVHRAVVVCGGAGVCVQQVQDRLPISLGCCAECFDFRRIPIHQLRQCGS